MNIKVTVYSYKKAQVFKRDYVRKDGQFLRLTKLTGSHSSVSFELAEGGEFDARGSIYLTGMTNWNSTDGQSWAKFRNEGGVLVAMNFEGKTIDCPQWCKSTSDIAQPVEEASFAD